MSGTLPYYYWVVVNGDWSVVSNWSYSPLYVSDVPNAPDFNTIVNFDFPGLITVTSPAEAYDVTMRDVGATVTVDADLAIVNEIYIGSGTVTVSGSGNLAG